MSVLVWVHDHIVWLLLGVVPCAAAIGWGLWLGRYQPVHAGGPVPERLWPLVGDPRAGSMQLADDQAWRDWREVAHEEPWLAQTRADLSPAALDEEVMSRELPDLRSRRGESSPDRVTEAGGRAGLTLASLGDNSGLGVSLAVAPSPDPEPEPVWTVAGRLVETSGEWLRRLERDAGPGWTYAGTVAA